MANIIPEEKKVPLLITCIGERKYKILKDLCDPVKPAAQHAYEKLCSVLDCLHLKFWCSVKRRILQSTADNTGIGKRVVYTSSKFSVVLCWVINLLIKDRLCEEGPEVELNKLVEWTIKREWTIKTSFSGSTEVYRMGKLINGDKQVMENGNKMFNKQWLFKEGSKIRPTGDRKTGN